MKTIKSLFIASALILGALPLMAQTKAASTGGVSPHETVSQTFDGARNNRVTITYGRPYTKNPKTGEAREIWGTLVPYGKVWRTGSDEATILITQKTIMFGNTSVPAGAYTLWMLPNEDGTAKLIINKQIGQWGVGPGSYDEKQDLARVDMKKDVTDKTAEQFTIAIAKNTEGGGILKLAWDNVQFTAAFTVQK